MKVHFVRHIYNYNTSDKTESLTNQRKFLIVTQALSQTEDS